MQTENLGWLEIAHIRMHAVFWGRENIIMTIGNWHPRLSFVMKFDWNHCYSLYIDKVRGLETMLDKVTVSAMLEVIGFFSLLMEYEREITFCVN